ncbi:NUDIX domain-containing protein [Angustibacter sp. McL0619]|uniref:NUDIX domain-containing protein n=1 Tax=Angustibacter sp. McL0619 TaxID=3415676 RepID=UPI003CE95E85
MSTRSAGILVHRHTSGVLQVLLGHMGGPLWSRKDEAAWSIPKGEYGPEETAEAAARREFSEELGLPVPDGELRPLGELRASSSKVLTIWALDGDLDVDAVRPGTFEMQWPPGSGRMQEFPEIDRAAWFDLDTARVKLVKGQRPYLDRLAAALTG